MRYIKSVFIIGFITLFAACSSEKEKESSRETSTPQISETSKKNEVEIKAEQVKNIFYMLPSPLELSILFKKEGIQYSPSKLLPVNQKEQFLISKKKALNLGVYGADLSYAGLFSQQEDAISYFTTCQTIAEELGIGQTFEKDFISRLERNADNRDTLMQVISDFFLNNDEYLKNHDQQLTSVYVLSGGWIEGLYLGTHMINKNTDTEGIKDIIASQKHSLNNLLLLIQAVDGEGTIDDLKSELQNLKSLYANVNYPHSEKGDGIKVSKKGSTIRLTNSKKVEIKEEVFNSIKEKVSQIRTSITTP